MSRHIKGVSALPPCEFRVDDRKSSMFNTSTIRIASFTGARANIVLFSTTKLPPQFFSLLALICPINQNQRCTSRETYKNTIEQLQYMDHHLLPFVDKIHVFCDIVANRNCSTVDCPCPSDVTLFAITARLSWSD